MTLIWDIIQFLSGNTYTIRVINPKGFVKTF